MSNDLWKKGQEIVLSKPEGNNSTEKLLMKDSFLCDFIADPHQKIYYVFDAPSQWTFYIELFKILPDSTSNQKFPVCVKVHGDAPKQFSSTEVLKDIADSEFVDDEMFNEVLGDEEQVDDEADITGNLTDEFEEAVDEEEYDNIEESSDEEGEKD